MLNDKRIYAGFYKHYDGKLSNCVAVIRRGEELYLPFSRKMLSKDNVYVSH